MTADSDARAYLKEGAQLADNHLALIKASAITPEVSRARGYRTIEVKARLSDKGFSPAQCQVPGLLIPVFNSRGECNGYQFRPDEPRVRNGKVIKYETPIGMRGKIDCNPLAREMLDDPKLPLIVTEGVRKADAAVSIGLGAIALLGVWNWRGTNEKGGKTALADWELIALNGRAVDIAFDSDVMENRKVHSALARLKAFLESRKATVKLIYLQSGEHGEKIGLDDFIAREKATGRSDAEIRGALLALATTELRNPPKRPTERPEILILPGRVPEIVDQATSVLVANASRLKMFQRGNEIVRVVALDRESERAGLRRPTGTVQLAAVTAVGLQETLERLISWTKPDRDDAKPADCPPRVAQTYLDRIGAWNLPVLTGVIEAPIMRLDGSIVSAPGYDESTGLFLYADADLPTIPEQPTRADAEAALSELITPFAEFPFVDEATRSVLIAAIITAIQRRLLESAPLFGFDAPGQRSGKSLLAEAVGIIATGRKPPSTGVARTDDELRKAITSALREGQAIVNLDNITRPLDSPDLARAITQFEYSDRLLGVNKLLRLRTNLLWTATGNNLTFKGDMPSRALLCRIDAKMERPEERVFEIPDLPVHLMANRKRLVVAALTILRAYHVAGRPGQNARPWGGFDHWSGEVRKPLLWLGLPDPCQTRERIIVNDPERDCALSILSDWRDAFSDRAVLVAEVIGEAGPKLRESLLMVAGDRTEPGKIDGRRLGAWCRSIEDRIFGDFQLSRDGSVRRATIWRVSCVSSVSSKPADQNGPKHAHSDAPGSQAPESVCASPSLDRHETNSSNSQDSPGDEIEEGSL
ncbi:MAG: DUF3854 domain-containing protein [Candidatus Binataceae bacterium]